MQHDTTNLFTPIEMGELSLNNRIIMAPLTRARAENHVPTPAMAEHYAARADAGLLIVEATMVMEGNSAFQNEPGIYSQEQIDAWRKVTDAVHAKGGKIVLQLWHGGRACHPDLNNGKVPVAASPLAITNDEIHTPSGKQAYTVPRELGLEEIPEIIAGFKQAAINAKLAGFDGVEIHGANGYLLDNFLRDGTNKRTDAYGGSVENRARLLIEVLEAVIDVWGSSRVGVRTSPLNSFNSMVDSDPVGHTRYLAGEFNRMQLAYWHLMRADFFGEQQGDVVTPAREIFTGALIANMGYSVDEANLTIGQEQIDAVAFGVPFIANPDLVTRFRQGAALNEPRPETFYTPGPEGYNDYPTLEMSEAVPA